MKVYALIGKSGTGKSYQAMNICKEKNIESIIDDGLFIYKSGIEAGMSAKRQSTKIGAIKTALFTEEGHRASAANKIKELEPDNILILGTSDGMVKKIAQKLELPEISDKIYIDDITTEGERIIASKQRNELGKHVIPVPTFQIKREFSGYFLDPLRIFKGWSSGKDAFSEKSVVRPTYSYLGDYIISDKVIGDIVNHLGEKTEGVDSVMKVGTKTTNAGIEITVSVFLVYGIKILEVAKKLQENIALGVEKVTAFNVEVVDIEIRGLK